MKIFIGKLNCSSTTGHLVMTHYLVEEVNCLSASEMVRFSDLDTSHSTSPHTAPDQISFAAVVLIETKLL